MIAEPMGKPLLFLLALELEKLSHENIQSAAINHKVDPVIFSVMVLNTKGKGVTITYFL